MDVIIVLVERIGHILSFLQSVPVRFGNRTYRGLKVCNYFQTST